MEGTPGFKENDNVRARTPRTRRKGKRKIEYVGWGSRVLLDFLQSIGKDTSKALSHYDVTNIVNEYVVNSKLIHPEKKKRVICDERLQTLFGGRKQSVFRNKIHDLLEPHLFENHIASEDDSDGLDEKEDDTSVASKRQKTSISDKKTLLLPKKKAPEVSKTALADMSVENIKLVYLKKSLVQEFLKKPETFESKVVGSFVKIKADRYDIYQKNSYQLELVTGVKNVASAGGKPPMLRLASTIDVISVSALSDDNFSEEECEDLRRRIQEGFVKQPTVGELEQKALMLHKDITRHWIDREIVVLKNRADQANEKGWRHKVAEYLDKKKLLQSIEEQARLLNEIPEVLPEKVKPETVPNDSRAGDNQNSNNSPKDVGWDREPCNTSSATPSSTNASSKQDNQEPHKIGTRSNIDSPPSSRQEESPSEMEQGRPESNGDSKLPDSNGIHLNGIESPETEQNGHAESIRPVQNGIPILGHSVSSSKDKNASTEDPNPKKMEIITLSDDEDEVQPSPSIATARLNPECFIWFYLDPARQVQGPFSLTTLKRWHGFGYFKPDFKVWASSQTQKQAVLLTDILQLVFPG
ncbi:hypothetical protein RND81_04G213900 [Saponaria officinalis]|uniref:Uncharacterized protein n=1 Tax=Saponaria officinalis TaxID=3572 RepID=A0AAW1LPP8_SAPOF